MAKPIGLFSILDEEIKFPNASKSCLLSKFDINLIDSEVYTRDKMEDFFVIKHYAGPVTYNPEQFIEKNRNYLAPEVIANMRDSSDEMINFLFTCPVSNTGRLNT